MNLSMDVLRILTVRALRGRTFALDKVLDSPATPENIRADSDRQPFIAVYVDEADTRDMSRPELSGPSNARLVIECGIASPFEIPQGGAPPSDDPATLDDTGGEPGANAEVVTRINATDAAMELQIGLITRQVRDALGDRATINPWAELWRILTNAGQVQLVEVMRGGPAATNMKPRERFASRVTVLHLSILGEPTRGETLDPNGFWFKCLAAMDGDDRLSGVGSILRSHFSTASGVPLPEWRVAQKRYMLPEDTIRGIGIAPVEGFDAISTEPTENAATLQEVETNPVPFSPYPSEETIARLATIRKEDEAKAKRNG